MTVAEVAQGLWSIPSAWIWVAIGDVAIVVGGGTPSTANPSNFTSEGIPWITPADLSGFTDKYISRGRRDISEKGRKMSNATLMPAGTVLLSSRAPVGYAAIASGPLTTNQGFKSFVLKGDMFPDYVYYYLRYSRGYLESLAGGTTFKELSGAAAKRVLMPFPPLPEQHRIVAEIETQFTRLDSAVATLKRAQANLKRYRASVLKAACEGRLVPTEAELARAEGREYEHASVLLERIRETSPNPLRLRRGLKKPLSASGEGLGVRSQQPQPPDTSNLPPLPEGWVWATLGQISEIQGGVQKQPKRSPRSNAFPFLRVANVFRERLDLGEIHSIELFEGELDKLRLEPGDLLIVEGNGSVSEIGRMAIWDGSIPNCVHQNHIIRARIVGGMFPQFASAYWNSPEGTARVMGVAASTSGLYTLSVSKISVLPVPLPPLAEQQRIVAEVERRLSVTQAAETAVAANLKRAERLRQAILKRAFEGKLVPQDSNDEPASVLLERIRAERDTSPNPLRARRGLSSARSSGTPSPLRLRRGAGGEV